MPTSQHTPAQDEASAPLLLEGLIHQAERANASDIHLQMLPGAASVSFRLDGVMTPASELTGAVAERVFGRIKFLARLKTYQESLPQDGRIDGASVQARSDIRVSTYPTVTGEKIVLRLFKPSEVLPLEGLSFPADIGRQLHSFLLQTSGLLLLTGPAGSGKTTTIYSCLRYLAGLGGRHIITVEDPAEQVLPGVMQTEINEAQGLTFAKAAKHLLRQDPQVIAVGEIRDEETANIAVRAALTGHLVMTTLHAGSCKGVLQRLVALCPDRSAVASATELILNQRLLRRLCAQCSGAGCAECLQTGYRGRLPIVEALRVDSAVRQKVCANDLESITASPGLAERAKTVVEGGLTSRAEVERVLGGAFV